MILRADSCLFIQYSLLAVLADHIDYMSNGIKPRSGLCTTSTLPTALSFQPFLCFLEEKFPQKLGLFKFWPLLEHLYLWHSLSFPV